MMNDWRMMRVVAGRDIRDSLRDWRMLIPLCVLSVMVPLLLLPGLRFAAAFLEDPGLAIRFVRIGLIVSGFLPAALSLVGSLEAFAGERERNTLESLLAMPISNLGLYVGKLLAALTAPLLSSIVAMTVYTVLAHVQNAGAFLGPRWLLFAGGVVLAQGTFMVVAAVFISIHANTIKSANLLSSMILLPTMIVLQLEVLFIIQGQYLLVLLVVGLLLLLTLAFMLQSIRFFNREALLSREHRAIGSATRGGLPRLRRRHGPLMNVLLREMQDTITDWRILVPLLLLLLVVPVLATGGIILAANRVDNALTFLPRLMPFLLLLVGFLPASFSLIIALEIFVGEKERGTLETLFAMPVSDTELYLGKTFAAMLAPLLAGICAMVLFLIGMHVAAPPELLENLRPMVVLGMLGLSVIQTAVMVAGAVIISSHTSTVRLANLLASFILLPMTVAVQIEALFILAERFDVLRWIALSMILITVVLVRSGIQTFKREAILAREHLAFNLGAIAATMAAFWREIRPAGANPDMAAPRFSLRRFYTRELRVVWRELRLPLLGVLVFSMLAAAYGTLFQPVTERELTVMKLLVPTRRIGTVTMQPSLLMGLEIFVGNSMRVLISGMLSALTFGLIGIMVPMIAFFSISYGASWSVVHGIAGGAMGFLLAYALPHGIIELPAAMLMSAAALRIGAATTFTPPTYTTGRHIAWGLALMTKVWVLVVVPLLLVSGLIEGLVTPLVMRSVYG